MSSECPRNVSAAPKNGKNKLLTVLQLDDDGVSHTQISRDLNITRQNVHYLVRKNKSHVDFKVLQELKSCLDNNATVNHDLLKRTVHLLENLP